MTCRICLEDCQASLEIFDANGKELNIANIIEKHLWFKPLPNDEISTRICRNCWLKICDFHQFYVTVEQAHINLHQIADLKDENLMEQTTSHLEIEIHVKEELLDGAWQEQNDEKIVVNPLEESEVSEVVLANDVEEDSLCAKSEDKIEDIGDENIDFDDGSDFLHEDDSTGSEFVPSPEVVAPKRKRTRNRGKNGGAKKEKSSDGVKRVKHSPISPLDDEMIKKHIPMGCDLCTFVGDDFRAMSQHFREKHKSIKPYVTCCGRKIRKRFVLVQHAYRHEDPDFFKCKDCQKVFADGYILRAHILANHAEENELKYDCNECGKKFARRSFLELHKPSHIPVSERQFICKHCPQRNAFASEHLLQIHVNMRHKKSTNICHVCAKEIRDNQAFEKHVRLHFETSGPRVKCPRPDCDRWLKDTDNLRQHLRRHNDDGKTYTCTECGKLYRNRKSLTSHINYTHSTDKFSCDECHKTFKRAISLKEHMAQHTGESLYKCPFCERTFNSNANMHSHKKKMHPVEWDVWRKTKTESAQKIISKTAMEAAAHSLRQAANMHISSTEQFSDDIMLDVNML